jgi:hypothetical protein
MLSNCVTRICDAKFFVDHLVILTKKLCIMYRNHINSMALLLWIHLVDHLVILNRKLWICVDIQCYLRICIHINAMWPLLVILG